MQFYLPRAMMSKKYAIVLGFFLVLLPQLGRTLLLNRPVDHDVFTGRHFDELATRNGSVFIPTVLAMYTPECDSKLQEHKMSDNLPPDYALAFARYDYVSTQKYVWYNFDLKDDLYRRYKPEKCFELLYFLPNSSVNNPTRIAVEPSRKLSEMLWDFVKVTFSVRNLYGKDIDVQLFVDGKRKSSAILHPGEEEEATAHTTHWLVVYEVETKSLIYGKRIDAYTNNTEIVVDRDVLLQKDRKHWLTWAAAETAKQTELFIDRTKTLVKNYLHNLKQPAVVENLTETGYMVTEAPGFLVKELTKLYNDNADTATKSRDLDTEYNVVKVGDDVIARANMVIKVSLEDWANADLTATYHSDLRAYSKGHTVPSHLYSLSDEVVGFMVIVDKKLNGSQDWILEIIGHNGVRKNLTLNTGKMLFYEPATVIVGRPYPFEGDRFLTFYCHYKPEHDWDWHISPDGKYFMKGNEKIEPVNILATPKTLERCSKRKKKDEL